MKMPLDDAEFVKEDRTYLQRKGSGGKDGRRGFQYEMRYGAWELIKLAHRVRHNQVDPCLATVTSQMPCYIDDLVIDDGVTLSYFEMKSGHTITWGNPETKQTLSWNFKRQRAFDERHRRPSNYTLILANAERYQVLEPKRPAGVAVVQFPLTYVIHEISGYIENFVETIADLLHAERRDEVLALLIGRGRLYLGFDHNDIFHAYCDFNKVYDRLDAATPQSLNDVLDDAELVSRGNLPYQPRDISGRLKMKLAEIGGVEFETCEGSLHFKTVAGVSGRFPSGIGSSHFRDFAAAIMAGKVTSIGDILDWANWS